MGRYVVAARSLAFTMRASNRMQTYHHGQAQMSTFPKRQNPKNKVSPGSLISIVLPTYCVNRLRNQGQAGANVSHTILHT